MSNFPSLCGSKESAQVRDNVQQSISLLSVLLGKYPMLGQGEKSSPVLNYIFNTFAAILRSCMLYTHPQLEFLDMPLSDDPFKMRD